MLIPILLDQTLYIIQVSAVSPAIHGLKCVEKVPKHTSHSKQQNHQIWSTEKKLNLIQIGWTMIKWQHLPRSVIETTLLSSDGNVDHDDIPALPPYWSTGAVFWDFRGASAKISGCKLFVGISSCWIQAFWATQLDILDKRLLQLAQPSKGSLLGIVWRRSRDLVVPKMPKKFIRFPNKI